VARDPPGTPFASVAPFGLDPLGHPILCVSALAEHTRNLRADPRGSLLIAAHVPPGTDPLALGRVTLVGEVEPIGPDARDEARSVHLAGNPHASTYIDYGDFSLWRLRPQSIRYVGGYGRMSWVDVDDWAAARPDPVAAFAASVIDHLNTDHADACLLMARSLGGRQDAVTATVTAVDRLGLLFRVTGTDGTGTVRLGFEAEATTPVAVRQATIALVRHASPVHGQLAEL
jgi:putative heme iron utilization protein